MKIRWVVILCMIVALLSACGTTDDKRDLTKNTKDVEDHNELYHNDQFGFVRQVKNSTQNDTDNKIGIRPIDREDTADTISKMAVRLNNVEDVNVLVTDQEVLVSYLINDDGKDIRFETADQVKKTAASVVPRWYHVYVTDDPALSQDVRNIASMTSTISDKDNTVRKTVKLMLERSPQGRTLGNGENANGETADQINPELEKTNYQQQFDRNQKRP
ncbi:YhcN/YlaJ family sporulation lipoprotein [Bacillus sp. FSL K6-3431]|uniref:YhcN/YlaJ family sporulation lipoprotein n=1 Tax=Bacillus sp. FSL K6-3431 TaxID=2921500 RepID=UPI0030F7D7C4